MKKFFEFLFISLLVAVIYNCDTAEPPQLPPAPVLDMVTVNIIDQTHHSITVDVKNNSKQ